MNKLRTGWYQQFLLVLFFVLASMITSAQSRYSTKDWRFSNPKQFGFTVFDVDFWDNNTAIAVGSAGAIARTTDGGANWTYGPFTFVAGTGLWTSSTFYDVHFVTANVVYAVGTGGLMVKSTDGGVTWAQVQTPLTPKARTINSVWFINKDTGYIGGQHNTPDSLPKLYFTRNGGTTWDSLNAPTGGKSRVGYVNNANLAPEIIDVTAKDKEILRIEFLNDSVGYIIGSGLSTYYRHTAVNSTTCLPSSNTTSGAHHASLVWKFTKGVLTDYSLSKERLGYTGVPAGTITCSSRYGATNNATQSYRALNILNDSTIIMMSFNNNIVIKVSTGKNDSTQNLAVPGLYERGKYTTLNFPFPPNGIGIPTPQVLLASNPYTIKRASNGKLFAPANFGYVWTSIDTGRNWKQETCLPQNRNYSGFGTWAMDIAPNGKFLVLGTNGVVSDSIPGGAWNSTYVTVPASASYSKIEFADCNNVIAAGTAYITVSTDGGNTWVDKMRSDFLASMYNINGMAYPKPNKAYFAVSNGVVYGSTDKGTTLDPLLNDAVMMMQDVAAKGDSVWAVGYTGYTVPSAQGVSKIYRSFNGGATWSTYSGFSVGSTSVRLTDIEFPTSTVGYAAGSRDTIYKTTDAGVTWTRLPLPNGGVAPQLTYTDMFALDANTVFIVGNGYPKIAVYKTTDGGATWTDITADIRTLGGGGYLYSVMFHDANNGYVGTGSILFKTTDGGATWTLDIAPVGVSFQSLAFSPKNVPASTSMVNRKLYGVGLTGPGGNSTSIMEYGDPANVNVNTVIASTTPASCTAPTAGSVTVTASGGIAPYTYSADGVNFQSSNVLTGLTYGTKTITVKDAFCGTTTKTVTIGLTDNMTLTTTPDTTVCIGANFPLMATPNGTGATYLWSPASVLNSATVANPTGAINAATAFTVTASMNGCVRTKTINVGVRANPVVNAGPDKTVVDGYTVVLQGTGIFSPAYLAWTPNATLTQPNTYNPTAKPSTTTTYRLTIKDNYNCTSTDDVVVNVLPYCVHPVDAFTPNNDGQNDKWIITSNNASCIDRIYASVYNRYGNLVFKDDNYKNNWDGTYNGKPVPDGTYYYVITYKLVSGPEVVLKGDVTILR